MDAGRVSGVGGVGGLPGGVRGWPSGLQMSGDEELGAMRQTLARDRVEVLAPCVPPSGSASAHTFFPEGSVCMYAYGSGTFRFY